MSHIDDDLRTALREEADSVTPGDGLTTIRQRTRGRGAVRATWRWLPPLAGALVAAGVVGAVVLVAGDDDGPGTSPQPVDTVEVQLWFADGRFVSPESVEVEDTGDAAVDAVNGLLTESTGAPGANPIWRCYGVYLDTQSVQVSGGEAMVSLAQGPDPDSSCPEADRIALQQLAYTLHAVDSSVQSVVVSGPGLGQAEAGASLDPYAKAPIIVDSPSDGATVTSPVQVSGESQTFEANVNWAVTDESGEVVEEGYTMGGTIGEWLPFEFQVELEPGEYTLTLTEFNMENGEVFYETSVPLTVE